MDSDDSSDNGNCCSFINFGIPMLKFGHGYAFLRSKIH